jgi:hypothetical protein
MIQSRNITPGKRMGLAVICALLALSHPLGVVYTGLLALLYLGFSFHQKTFSLVNVAVYFGAPLGLLVWLPAFMVQRMVNMVFPPGRIFTWWQIGWDYVFLGSKVLFSVVLLGGILFIIWWWRQKSSTSPEASIDAIPQTMNTPENRQLLIYAIVFLIAMNGIVAVLDGANIVPVFMMRAYRYVLVCLVSYAIIGAFVVEGIEALLKKACPVSLSLRGVPILRCLVGLALLVSLELYWNEQYSYRVFLSHYVEELSGVAHKNKLEVICDARPNIHPLAFYMATRSSFDKVKYVLPDDYPVGKLMVQAQKYYPSPVLISPLALAQTTNEYLLLNADLQAVLVNSTKAPPSTNSAVKRTP